MYYQKCLKYCACIKRMTDPRNLEHLEEINKERVELHKDLCNFCGLGWDDTKEFTDNLPMTTVEQQADWLNKKITERVEEYWWYITLNLYHDSWYLTYDFSKEDKERAHVKRKEYNDACIAVRDKRAGKELPMQKYREFLKIVDEVNEHRLVNNAKMIKLRKAMREKPESVVDNRYYLQWVSSYVGIPYESLNSLIKKTLEDKEWGEYDFDQELLKIIRSYIN